ncbi:MAG: siderophore-interacting protein [Janthinobacterium lividum]
MTDTATSNAQPDRSAHRVRHALRFRLLEVRAVERPSPHLVRITVGGDQLEGFTSPGFDDHCKLFFPDPLTGALQLPQAGPDGPVYASEQRPIMRDYTPHSFDATALTLQFDFALHDAGPATRWASQAEPGQMLGVGGPRGSFLLPFAFDWHLMIGDDTALPAITRRLAELPAGARALVLIEVASAADEAVFESAARIDVQWIHRDAQASRRLTLPQAAATLAFLPGDYCAWVGCESSDSKALREFLLGQRHANPDWLKVKSYWRRGAADGED